MYCPSCGTELKQELSYCQRCGANLSISKASGESKSLAELLAAIIVISLALPGLILGGMIVLKFNEFSQWLILLFMVLVFLILLGLDSVLVWQLLGLNRRAKDAGAAPQLERPNTKELDARQEQALIEPMRSVTENTTRLFEPTYEERRTK